MSPHVGQTRLSEHPEPVDMQRGYLLNTMHDARCTNVVRTKVVALLGVRTSNAVGVLKFPLLMHSELP